MAASGKLTMEDKDMLLSRVNQLVFVDEVADFKCVRCNQALIQHYIANCGHKYCDNCRNVLTIYKGKCSLAHCKKLIENIDRQDSEYERKLYNLMAHCPNKNFGCPFISKLQDLGAHLKMCKDTKDTTLPVLIPDNNLVEAVLREMSSKFDSLSENVKNMEGKMSKSLIDNKTELENYFKKMIKENEMTTFKDIDKLIETTKKLGMDFFNFKSHLKEQAIKKEMMDMKNNKQIDELKYDLKIKLIEIEKEMKSFKQNSDDIERKIEDIKTEFYIKNDHMTKQIKSIKVLIDSMETNFKDEMKQLISYKFDEKMPEWKTEITKLEKIRKQQNRFLIQFNKSNALNALEKNGFDLEKFIELRFTQMNCVTLTENESNFQPDFTWKISGIKEIVKQENFELKSEVFEWTGYRVKAQAKLKFDFYGFVEMSLCLEEHNEGEAIDLKPIPQVYYVLRDRTKTNNPNHLCGFNPNLLSKKSDNSIPFNSLMCKKSKFIGPPYKLDDSIVIEIYVEPQEMSREVYSYDGTLVWALDNYYKRKEIVKDELVFYQQSPYFYTGPKGYRVQVDIRLNAIRMIAVINFMPGEFNADLPMTFRFRTTITLFSHKALQRNLTKTLEKDFTTEGNFATIDVCSIDEVENYLLNDTLFYKVTIELLK